jgi:hypothetical protein
MSWLSLTLLGTSQSALGLCARLETARPAAPVMRFIIIQNCQYVDPPGDVLCSVTATCVSESNKINKIDVFNTESEQLLDEHHISPGGSMC